MMITSIRYHLVYPKTILIHSIQVQKSHYSIAEAGLVSLKVFDILGREVSTLVNDIKKGQECMM
jgi:hypothetical protein